MQQLNTQMTKAQLNGTIERVIMRSDETGWTVLNLDVGGDSKTVVGLMPEVDEGLQVAADGNWHSHPKFGQQFKADNVRIFAPVSRDGIERFLRSGAVNGIGKKFASMIVSRFGDKTLEVIENDSWRLKYLKGVGPKRIEAVRKGVKEYRGRMETMSFLHGKLGPVRAQRVYQKYGDDSRKLVSENPYRLIDDFEGFGFAIADQVAGEVGVGQDNPMRLRAALLTVLQSASRQGHTCVPLDRCVEDVEKLLGSRELAEQIVMSENAELPWHKLRKEGAEHLELTRFRYLDERVAKLIRGLTEIPPRAANLDAGKAIPWAASQVGLSFEEGQARAIELALTEKVCVITGGPGVGKTTILNALLRIFNAKKYRVSLAAPTGRAARRMSESTGQSAETLHKLLEYSPRSGGFLRKRDNPLDLDILIVDEASMTDLALLRSTLEAVPGWGRLVLVGDKDQLPSVGPGQVLADLIESGCVPVATLDKPYRQAANSAIIQNAHLINLGQVPDLHQGGTEFEFYPTKNAEETAERLLSVVCEKLPAEGVDPKEDLLCLVPMHRGKVGIEKLNVELQSRINGSPPEKKTHGGRVFGVGDKVMQHRNNRDLMVFNGDLGIVRAINNDAKHMVIRFDSGDVDYPFAELSALGLAYCSSVHKAQGSECDVVVVAIDMSNAVLLSRKLLYTAITRAKKRVILVGQERAIHIAVSEARAHTRSTMLRDRLIEAFSA
jgi:exodeoxyribonuclease V alpha subunit